MLCFLPKMKAVERPGSAGRREPIGDHENIFCAGSAATASSARRMRYSAASTRSSDATDSVSPLPSIPERGLSRCVTQVCCCPGIQQYPQVRDRPEVAACISARPPARSVALTSAAQPHIVLQLQVYRCLYLLAF